MKKVYLLFTMAFLAFSCTSDEPGPPGPQGPQGPTGEPGPLATVFEVVGDFTPENDFSLLVNYADHTDVEVFESDVVLVYLRVATDGEAGGEPVYVWRLLPQTYYLDGGGEVQYNYDFTFFDTSIFLNSTVDLSTLGTEFTNEQVFRIAIVPGEFAENTGVDVSDYHAVMSALKVRQQEIPQLELQ